MREQFTSYENATRDPQEKQMKEIEVFCKRNEISSKELFDAYEMAMGSDSEESEKTVREEVKTLAKMLDNFMENGLPVNRIVELVDLKGKYESACDDYYALVNSLQINDKGKKMLHSIVERKRSGTIMINDLQTSEKIEGFGIPNDVAKGEYSQNDLAMALMRYLSRYKDKKVEIIFSE